jgi:S1-C subfamily serine protease
VAHRGAVGPPGPSHGGAHGVPHPCAPAGQPILNTLDLLVVALAAGAALGGFRLGFLTRVSSWIGLSLGVVIGSLVLPSLLRALDDASSAQLLFVTLGILLGAAFVGQAVGLLIGSQLHATLPRGTVRSADRAAGGVAGVIGVFIGFWVLLPLMADVPGWFATQARTSSIARFVDDRFPEPPDTVETLRRLVGEDQFPRVFDALERTPDVGPPPTSTNIPQPVVDQVVPSTVKVEGVACRRIQEGSGFVVGDGLVVTNAHVVAGEDETILQRSDGSEVRARVVAFDPNRDLAVLAAPDLDRPAMDRDQIAEGGVGAAFGHPQGGPLRAAPFSVGQITTAQGTDIYDRNDTTREVLILAADLEPGDSGSALVDPDGDVVGVVFAIALDRPGVAYALAMSELEAVLAGDLSRPVDTGPCLH